MISDKTQLYLHLMDDEDGWVPAEADYLPEGGELRVYKPDEGDQISILMARFPPGYVEPRHVHSDTEHWGIVVEGEMHMEGEIFRLGDFFYAPVGVEHGPFTYPVGCTVFVFMRGGSAPAESRP
jgi:anti-sigma factor ChrR (cupin superfamily)